MLDCDYWFLQSSSIRTIVVDKGGFERTHKKRPGSWSGQHSFLANGKYESIDSELTYRLHKQRWNSTLANQILSRRCIFLLKTQIYTPFGVLGFWGNVAPPMVMAARRTLARLMSVSSFTHWWPEATTMRALLSAFLASSDLKYFTALWLSKCGSKLTKWSY